jgi:hypothetical protein
VIFPIEHILQGGVYARRARLPEGAIIVGALVRIPTTLIVHGDAWVYAGKWHHIRGQRVISGEAGRKQIFAAVEPTEITMSFPTQAKTVQEAEAEFTDETAKLQTRRGACQA